MTAVQPLALARPARHDWSALSRTAGEGAERSEPGAGDGGRTPHRDAPPHG